MPRQSGPDIEIESDLSISLRFSTGITKISSKIPYKVSTINKIYKHSKVFYLPTRFVSNGKPLKPIVLSLAKRKSHYHRKGSPSYATGMVGQF